MPELVKTKEEIMDKAYELGVEYEKIYGGCAQSTFYALVDALRWGGLEVIPEDVANNFYPGICLLTAGTCMTGEGTCGAVAGGTMASGLAFGLYNDLKDPMTMDAAGARVRDTLLDHFYREYGSILCKDVMRKYFGKAWDLTNPEMTQEFLGITDGCVIRDTAKYMAGVLVDKYLNGELKIS
ncbi:MAG: C_GCAxxG_C_C family protein [Dehalococcoidales bacterium]|nr:C_GCAxxG_C_C family protein [Dehalococcoidales bacterium]